MIPAAWQLKPDYLPDKVISIKVPRPCPVQVSWLLSRKYGIRADTLAEKHITPISIRKLNEARDWNYRQDRLIKLMVARIPRHQPPHIVFCMCQRACSNPYTDINQKTGLNSFTPNSPEINTSHLSNLTRTRHHAMKYVFTTSIARILELAMATYYIRRWIIQDISSGCI